MLYYTINLKRCFVIKVNDILNVAVTDISVNGDGICKTEDGFPLFVKGTVLGDKAKVKITKLNKTYGFASLLKITEKSPDRITSPCDIFEKCGGCSLMETNYNRQISIKENHLLSNLKRIGGYEEGTYIFEGVMPCDDIYNYRNKAQFPLGIHKGKAVCGFYENKSHTIVPCTNCKIQNEHINKTVNVFMEFVNKYNLSIYDEKTHKGLIRHIYVRHGGDSENSIMAVVVANSKKPIPHSEKLCAMLLEKVNLKSLVQNINTKKSNVVLGYENICLWGDNSICANANGLEFIISPNSFFQVNYKQMEKLYFKAKEYLAPEGHETIFDLYSGVGSISLYMADRAKKVVGVEIVEPAVENAKINQKKNNIDNCEFYCGDCTTVVRDLMGSGYSPDGVVVDPPRKGCDKELLNLINEMSPKKLVYVSCNSATLARDLSLLRDMGYTMEKCCGVDMFPHSMHVECCAKLCRS